MDLLKAVVYLKKFSKRNKNCWRVIVSKRKEEESYDARYDNLRENRESADYYISCTTLSLPRLADGEKERNGEEKKKGERNHASLGYFSYVGHR